MDVSADLSELARAPVAIVTSGAKSVLDIPSTLQALETLGVPIVGFQTEAFPGFFVVDTGLVLEHRVDDEAHVARLLEAHRGVEGPGRDAAAAELHQVVEAVAVDIDQGRSSSVVICNPCPGEHALDRATVEEAVERAVHQASAAGVSGKDVTPFLLRRLDTLTEGASLQANLALLEHNSRVAAKIAVTL